MRTVISYLIRTKAFMLPAFLITAATLIKLSFPEYLGPASPFILYTAVIVITAWNSGWLIATVTNVISMILISYFFLQPSNFFTLRAEEYIHLSIFLSQNFIIIGVVYAWERTHKKSVSAEQRFKLLAEKACDLLVLRDQNGKATYVSPKVSEIYGYTPSEYMEMSLEKLVMPEYYEYFTDNLKEIMTMPDGHRVLKAQFKRKDGDVRWLEGDVYNYLHVEGINSIVSHIKDVTERELLERQKDEFIGIASHEFKTPAANIKAYTQLAEKAIDTNPQRAKEFLRKSTYNIQRLNRLVSDMLDISRIRMNRLLYEYHEFDFSNLLSNTVSSLQLQHKSHKLTLQEMSPVIIHGDKFRLEQVLINLIDNAVKYSPGANEILISHEITNRHLVVSVQDFGIGISKEHIELIFNLFYRVEITAMKYQGLGLGLYICAEIVTSHKGNIWVESVPGSGTSVYFLLPLAKPQEVIVYSDNKTFYEDDTLKIRYNDQHDYMEVNWIGYHTYDTLQHAGIIILEFVNKLKATRVLNNNSEVKGNWSTGAEEGGKVWLTLMEKAGVTHFAWVISSEVFSRLSATKSLEVMSAKIEVKLFDQKEDALAWLI